MKENTEKFDRSDGARVLAPHIARWLWDEEATC